MNTEFKDGDILISDSKNIISMLKGDYNNGEFRDHVCLNSEGVDINPSGVWDGITDWRLATDKEKEKLYKAIEIQRKKVEYNLKKNY